MAGDWIKVRDNLHEDPAVATISDALKIDVYGVIGRLVRIWTWADQQVEDGNAFVTLVYLDQLVSTPGMADAMVLARWLEVPENGRIRFPKYDRHMSKPAKKRALTNKRVQQHRSNAPVTQTKRPGVTREEKSSSTNKHSTVLRTRAVDNQPRKVQGGLTTSTPTPPQPPLRSPATGPLKPPAAMTQAEREAAGIAAPPAELLERFTKPQAPATPVRAKGRHELDREPRDPTEPSDDELLQQLRKPTAPATVAANGRPPADWAESPEGIDRAGEVLGMKRLPFEEDPDFARRIEARIALG